MRTWDEIEKTANIAIPPIVRRATPLPGLIIVVVEMPPERTEGGLYKTRDTVDREMGGSGWIVAVGPCTGELLQQAASLGSQYMATRQELLGRHICWGKYAGDPLVVTDRDDEFRSRFRVIKEEHVLLVLDESDTNKEGIEQ